MLHYLELKLVVFTCAVLSCERI